jgi:DNA polymerase
LKLPSSRKLAYPIARTKLIDPQRGVVLFADNSAGRWRDCRDGRGAYGGVWTENVVQAISRDLLADAMLRIEAAGYRICSMCMTRSSPKCRKGSAAPRNSLAS